MNIRQFECLRAIMTTGSMTQAAENLGISQPSASSLISNLEYRLGFKLFDRVKGRLVATPEAKHFLPDVTRALDSIDQAMRQAQQIRDNRYGDLTIASYPNIAIDFLPAVMSAFLADSPDVRVRLLARRSEMMSGLLPMQEFDMAIVTQLAETRQFEIEKIEMPCVVAYGRGRAPVSDSVGPRDLQHEKLVTLMPTHPTVTQLEERFTQEGTPYPAASIETQTFESACGFIGRGIGAGLIDPITAGRYAGDTIETRRFTPEVTQTIYLLTPADRLVSSLLRAFRERLLGELKALCQ